MVSVFELNNNKTKYLQNGKWHLASKLRKEYKTALIKSAFGWLIMVNWGKPTKAAASFDFIPGVA